MSIERLGLQTAVVCAKERATNAGALGVLLHIAIAVAIAGCAGYVPGRQSYWDSKLNEMCQKDGGVQILEKIQITSSDTQFLDKIDGKFAVPPKNRAHPLAPVVSEESIQYLRKNGGPTVWRTEYTITRHTSGTVVARWVVYTRAGGDSPGLAHDSSYICPDLGKITSDMQQLFVVVENPK